VAFRNFRNARPRSGGRRSTSWLPDNLTTTSSQTTTATCFQMIDPHSAFPLSFPALLTTRCINRGKRHLRASRVPCSLLRNGGVKALKNYSKTIEYPIPTVFTPLALKPGARYSDQTSQTPKFPSLSIRCSSHDPLLRSSAFSIRVRSLLHTAVTP
jgi:hypothetical protein